MEKTRILSYSQEPFLDRREAGRLLSGALSGFKNKAAVVLGIPRGGVVVAAEISRLLAAELDIIVSHKLSAPFNPELAIGAVSEAGKTFLNTAITRQLGIEERYIKQETERQTQEIKRKIGFLRKIRPKISLKDRIVIITDDGLATGATMQASVWAAAQEQPRRLLVAIPVASQEALTLAAEYADEVICLRLPDFFGALSQFYVHFPQTSDEEVAGILRGVTL